MKKSILILFSFLIGYISADARLISGQVTCSENGKPAIGASVLIKGTNIGTITDIDGYYQITVDSMHTTLRYSYVDYITNEIKIKNDSVINVSLEREDIVLDEFIITAYVEHIKPSYKVTRDTIMVHRSKIHKFFKLKGRRHIRCGLSLVSKGYNKLLRIEKDWFSASTLNNNVFLKHIYDNINYPDSFIYDGIEGRMTVRFMINLEGNIKEVEILQNLDNRISNEVFSVLQSIPQLSQNEINQWKCEKYRTHIGIYILPIRFRIKED